MPFVRATYLCSHFTQPSSLQVFNVLPVHIGSGTDLLMPTALHSLLLTFHGYSSIHWGMKGILFLTAPILPTFVASFGRCIKMLMVPCSVLCGTRTRKLSAIAKRPSSMWLMTSTKTRPHKPMLGEWTSEILSLSLSLGLEYRGHSPCHDQLCASQDLSQALRHGQDA